MLNTVERTILGCDNNTNKFNVYYNYKHLSTLLLNFLIVSNKLKKIKY